MKDIETIFTVLGMTQIDVYNNPFVRQLPFSAKIGTTTRKLGRSEKRNAWVCCAGINVGLWPRLATTYFRASADFR